MKKGGLLVSIVLCSFFMQQVFSFSWEIIQNNIEIEALQIDIEEILIDDIIINDIIQDQSSEIIDWDISIENQNNTDYQEDEEILIIVEEDQGIEVIEIEDINIINIEDIQSDNTWEEITIIEFGIDFQNPSYILEKDLIKNSYTCDPEREECKVNFKLVDAQWEGFSSKYECLIEFSSIIADDNRCNPTTVILTESTEITFSLFHEENPENISIKKLDFILDISPDVKDETVNWTWSLEEIIETDLWWTDEPLEVEIIENTIWNDEINVSWTGVISNTEIDIISTATGGIIWETINTWTGTILDETSSWVSISENTVINSDKIIDLPEIILDIQSGLEYSGSWNIYVCDKQECKINLDISDSFSGAWIESDYECLWDFWSGSFSTQLTDKKCNPWYVNYSTGSHEIFIQIYSADNPEYFTESSLVIQNNFYEDLILSREEIAQENTDELDNEVDSEIIIFENIVTGSWEIILENSLVNSWSVTWSLSEIEEIFLFPDVYIEIQSWAEYIDDTTLKCNKEDCKINLDVSNIFNDTYSQNNYECRWDFGSGSFSTQWTDEKCNPWYIDYYIWNDAIIFRLSEKNNSDNFIEKIITLQNDKIVTITSSSSSSSTSSSSRSSSNSQSSGTNYIDYAQITEDKNIIIQSWLENNSCELQECKINLNYENSSYETCIWDFWWLDVPDKYHITCNPGFIYAWAGIYKINLKIFNSKVDNYFDKTLIIYNKYIADWAENNDYFEIILQWKQVDYKKYYDNKIVCFWVEKCNINLILETNSKEDLEYIWDFWNWEMSESQNPKSLWFSSGSYTIDLNIISDNQTKNRQIQLEVISPIIPIEQLKIAQEFEEEIKKDTSFFTQLENMSFGSMSLAFDKHIDISEKIKNIEFHKIDTISWFKESNNSENIKLQLTRNIDLQKKAIKISGTTFANSNIYISKWDEIIELASDENWKYQEKFINMSAWVFELDYYVLDSQWKLFESNKSKELILEEEYIREIAANNNKNIENKQAITKKTGLNEIHEETNQSIQIIKTDFSNQNIIKVTERSEYIFQFILFILTLIGWIILFRKYKIL